MVSLAPFSEVDSVLGTELASVLAADADAALVAMVASVLATLIGVDAVSLLRRERVLFSGDAISPPVVGCRVVDGWPCCLTVVDNGTALR